MAEGSRGCGQQLSREQKGLGKASEDAQTR